MEGWLQGQMDGGRDGWMDRWRARWKDRRRGGWTKGQMHIWTFVLFPHQGTGRPAIPELNPPAWQPLPHRGNQGTTQHPRVLWGPVTAAPIEGRVLSRSGPILLLAAGPRCPISAPLIPSAAPTQHPSVGSGCTSAPQTGRNWLVAMFNPFLSPFPLHSPVGASGTGSAACHPAGPRGG